MNVGGWMKFLLFGGALAGLWFVYDQFIAGSTVEDMARDYELEQHAEDFVKQTATAPSERDVHPVSGTAYTLDNYLPIASIPGQRIDHGYYQLYYSEKHEQAAWVAYRLTRDQLELPTVARTDDFRPDPMVASGSAQISDYQGSGYDRGHLVPAADRAYSDEAMSSTFYLSNASPQAIAFNRGIWKELEHQTRDWARAAGELYIVTGPVLQQQRYTRIGDNRVAVPKAFFKVLLDLREPEQKAIGFVMSNQAHEEPLDHFMRSVDEVEAITGIDFFASLPDEQEAQLERTYNASRWIYDEVRYKRRLVNQLKE